MMARVTLVVVVLACCMVAALGREDAAVLRSNAETQVKALKAKVEQACMPRCTLRMVSLPSTAPHLTTPPPNHQMTMCSTPTRTMPVALCVTLVDSTMTHHLAGLLAPHHGAMSTYQSYGRHPFRWEPTNQPTHPLPRSPVTAPLAQ